MAANFPGPYQLRLFYNVAPAALPAMDHVLQLNCDPTTDPDIGDAFSTIALNTQAGATTPLDTAVDGLEAVFEDLFSVTDTAIDRAELWKFEPLTFESSFVSTYPIAGAGTDGGNDFSAGQTIYTFRTEEGGFMRVTLQEPRLSPGESVLYGNLGAASLAFVDYFLAAATNVWLGRDTSYPLVFHKLHPGQSEALFKARFR